MKKRSFISILGLSLITGVAFVLSVTAASSAWFSRFASHEPGWKSGSDGAYFAYGNGKIENAQQKDRPYGITRPLHLYNLAWLQYLGFFDKDTIDDSYTKDNVYFELANDLDMTGWVLPPIGTKDKPFIGNFNGNGYKITNLTVSNNFDSYNRTPYGILNNLTKEQFKNNVNILGLFGVVGDYNGAVGGTYSTSANEIINTGISNLTVASSSTTSLVGLAAGYVNGSIEGVAVNDSYIDMRNSGGQAITSITNNISDYSLIGYAASQDYLAKLQSSTTVYDSPTVSNPFVSQGGDEWGASIEMKKMYNTMHAKMENSNYLTFNYTYYDEYEREFDGESGTFSNFAPIPSTGHSSSFNITTQVDGVYHYSYSDTGTRKNGNPVQTACYTFANDNAKNSLASNKYVGLSGRRSFTTTEDVDYVTTYPGAFALTDGGSNCLYADGSRIGSRTIENATPLYLDDSGGIYYWINSTKYYLNRSSTLLSTSTTKSTNWTWDSTNHVFKNSTYYLVYYQNVWTLRTSLSYAATNYYLVSDTGGTHYLSNNGTTTSFSTVTDLNAAGHCGFTTAGSNEYLYFYINGTNYYAYASISNNSWTPSLSTSLPSSSNNRAYYLRRINTNGLAITYSNRTFYLLLNSDGSMTLTGTTSYLSITNVSTPAGTLATAQSTCPNKTQSDTQTITAYSKDTYFPLTWEDDSAINPSDKNTGYVVGGANYLQNDSIGDVRLASYYDTSMLNYSFVGGSSGSYSNSNLFAYTFDINGNRVKIGDEINGMKNASGYSSYTSLGLKKYYYSLLGRTTGSRVGLGNMLGNSGTNPAYGLHFMNADISMDNLTNVEYAKINGVEYDHYDLPRDSIDFNLKADGFINFFAATYFLNGTVNNPTWNNSNNSFFSLHSIDRNDPNEQNASPNTIDSIKQIARIYKNTQYSEVNNDVPQYVYTYRDSSDNEVTNSWDTGVRDENGTLILGGKGDLVFDTYWLTDPEKSKFQLRALYYFEIPVNKGEFALGSTSGKTKSAGGWGNYNKNGAYLLYLDIGAGVKNSTAVTINEKSTTTTFNYNYPKGIDFATVSSSTIGDYSDILGGETSAIVVPSSNTANTKYVYTPKSANADASLIVGPTTGGGGYTATYKTVDTVVKDTNNANIGIVSASSSVDVMEREIMYDLTVESNNYTVTTQHTIDGVKGAVTSVTTTEYWSEEQIMTIANFDIEGVGLFTVVYSSTQDSNGQNVISIESTYNHLTHAYVINFVSTENNKTVDIMFTSLNLSQSYQVDDSTINYNYTLSVGNTVLDTSAALGNITSTNLNKSYTLVCGLAS